MALSALTSIVPCLCLSQETSGSCILYRYFAVRVSVEWWIGFWKESDVASLRYCSYIRLERMSKTKKPLVGITGGVLPEIRTEYKCTAATPGFSGALFFRLREHICSKVNNLSFGWGAVWRFVWDPCGASSRCSQPEFCPPSSGDNWWWCSELHITVHAFLICD